MSDQVVTFTPAENAAIGTITLNKPPANSYDIDFVHQLDACIGAADKDASVRVVVLRSASAKFFSAGADIKAFMASTSAANMAMIETAHAALSKIAASNKIYIAAINGHALGGGLEMALACDLRFAGEGQYGLGLPEVTLGLLPGNGGTQRLSRLIGPNKALELMLTGERVTPQQALALGIVNRIFASDTFEADVLAYATKLATGAHAAVGAIKRAVYDGIAQPLAGGLALERELIAPLFDTEDAREGMRAFAEKRTPVYKGK